MTKLHQRETKDAWLRKISYYLTGLSMSSYCAPISIGQHKLCVISREDIWTDKPTKNMDSMEGNVSD